MVKLIFLGTGTSQGIPVIGSNHPVCLSKDPKDKRLRSSVLLDFGEKKKIIIDCGPDFRQQMLREKVTEIQAILFTHEHNDHVMGLDDIRPFLFRSKKSMPIYALSRVLAEIRKRFPYVYVDERYPGAPSVEENNLRPGSKNIEGLAITAIPLRHGDLDILGYKINNSAYLTDVSELPNKESLYGLDVLVLDCLRKEINHHSHLILPQALELIVELKPKKTYLTHISHYLGFHEEVSKELPANVHLAYDGLCIDI